MSIPTPIYNKASVATRQESQEKTGIPWNEGDSYKKEKYSQKWIDFYLGEQDAKD